MSDTIATVVIVILLAAIALALTGLIYELSSEGDTEVVAIGDSPIPYWEVRNWGNAHIFYSSIELRMTAEESLKECGK